MKAISWNRKKDSLDKFWRWLWFYEWLAYVLCDQAGSTSGRGITVPSFLVRLLSQEGWTQPEFAWFQVKSLEICWSVYVMRCIATFLTLSFLSEPGHSRASNIAMVPYSRENPSIPWWSWQRKGHNLGPSIPCGGPQQPLWLYLRVSVGPSVGLKSAPSRCYQSTVLINQALRKLCTQHNQHQDTHYFSEAC